jgi:hypothetical protein
METASALSGLSFHGAVLLYPLATVLHIVEAWPAFPRWARRFASPLYDDREYLRIHVAAVAIAVLAALAVRAFPAAWIVFTFFAFVFGPGIFWNALFHAWGSVISGRYCPGVLTGLMVYLPLSFLVAGLAVRDGLIGEPALLIAALIGAAFHVAEVGHNVFKRW